MLALLGDCGREPAPPAWDVEIAGFLLDPAATRGDRRARRAASRSPRPLAGRSSPGAARRRCRRRICRSRRRRSGRAKWPLPSPNSRRCCSSASRATASTRCSATSRCRSPPCSRAWSAPACASTRRRCARSRANTSASSRASRREIHELAGERFQIASPKQLQAVLFEKLKLPAVRKTKTGFSTDEDVLEQLASQHALPARDPRLPAARQAEEHLRRRAAAAGRSAKTGRIHPTFHQIGAATGRLSASNPNVQNIPIRSEEGVRIREAFVPRARARCCSRPTTRRSSCASSRTSRATRACSRRSARGEDVHRRTAAERARHRARGGQRRAARARQGDQLRDHLRLDARSASRTSSASRRPRRRRRSTPTSRATGACAASSTRRPRRRARRATSRTLLGRRRYLPDLASRNRVLRNAAERMAVNTVIQGTAADLIKKAMVEVDAALREAAARRRDDPAGPRRAGLRGAGAARSTRRAGSCASAWRRCGRSTCRCWSRSARVATGARLIDGETRE